jgi:hypothetical protein
VIFPEKITAPPLLRKELVPARVRHAPKSKPPNFFTPQNELGHRHRHTFRLNMFFHVPRSVATVAMERQFLRNK